MLQARFYISLMNVAQNLMFVASYTGADIGYVKSVN